MSKVDAGEFPNDLVGIDTSVEVAALNGISGKGPQHRSPLRVQLSDAIADDTARCIVQLEDRGRNGASARLMTATDCARNSTSAEPSRSFQTTPTESTR